MPITLTENAKNYLIEWNGEEKGGDVWFLNEAGEKQTNVGRCYWRSSQGAQGDDADHHFVGIKFPNANDIVPMKLIGKLNWIQVAR